MSAGIKDSGEFIGEGENAFINGEKEGNVCILLAVDSDVREMRSVALWGEVATEGESGGEDPGEPSNPDLGKGKKFEGKYCVR